MARWLEKYVATVMVAMRMGVVLSYGVLSTKGKWRKGKGSPDMIPMGKNRRFCFISLADYHGFHNAD